MYYFNKIIKINLYGITFRSFIIITQPHCNNIPVTVYDGNRSKSGTAKISVTIICLLHDFIQTHPNMIKLNDIGRDINFHYYLI